MKMILPLSAHGVGLERVPTLASEAEAAGFDGVSISEIDSDPMVQMTLAARETSHVQLMTNIVVAFARSPMTLATQATAIQEYSEGRLVLGLGSQIKPHIERRFSMSWSAPAARMSEYVQALRAIWHSWQTGERLNFEGEFYTHTLMIPEYAPTVRQPRPAVFIAAVGERMTAVAGAVGDGVILHPFTTPRFIREVTIPALERGAQSASRPPGDVQVTATPFVISGRSDQEIAESRELVRLRIAFYGSTPAYRPVLQLHGWEDLGDELNRMSKTDDPDRWNRMGTLVSDEVLNTFAIEGSPDDVGGAIVERFGSLIDIFSVNQKGIADPATLMHVMDAVRTSETKKP